MTSYARLQSAAANMREFYDPDHLYNEINWLAEAWRLEKIKYANKKRAEKGLRQLNWTFSPSNMSPEELEELEEMRLLRRLGE